MKSHALKSATLAAALMTAAGVASAQSPFCNTNPLVIADNDPVGVTATQTIPDSFTLTDLDVSLDVTHTWVGDLIFTISNGTTTVVFFDRPGFTGTGFGCAGDDISATLDDEGAGGPVENMCGNLPAIFDTPTPNNPLSAFDGQNIQGTWTLTASDNAVGDTGQVNSWCLVTTPVPVELMEFEVK